MITRKIYYVLDRRFPNGENVVLATTKKKIAKEYLENFPNPNLYLKREEQAWR